LFFSLDRRCGHVLDALAKYDDYVTIDSLSAQLGQTRRNTQYDLCKINDAFKLAGISTISSRRNRGIKLLDEQKTWWENLSLEGGRKFNYIFTQDERVALIICESLLSNEINTIEEMSEELKVSRNTVFLDMKIVKEKLNDYGIRFEYVSKSGYTVSGDGLKIRSVLMYFISAIYPLISDGIINFLSDPQVREHQSRLHKIEQELDVNYPAETIDKIAIMLKLTKREIPLNWERQEANIRENPVYRIVSRYYPSLSENDRIYVSIQLLGARLRDEANTPDDSIGNFKNMAGKLVAYFQRLVGIEIENKELLIFNLARHLNRSIYRYQYGLIDSCGVEEEIQANPKELFELVKLAAKEFSRDIGYPINDSEVAFLTIHFGAHMRKNNVAIGKIKVLLVVKETDPNGELEKKVDDEFPMFHVVRTVTPAELSAFQGEYQIVISTQLLKYDGFYAYISDRLEAEDKKKVLEVYLKYRMLKNENIGENLFENIKKYIPKENQGKVRMEINRYFLAPVPNLLQLLEKGNVQCIDKISNWRDALAQAALPLLENGNIETSYVDCMITDNEMYGCSTYLGNGVYLAHTQSRGNVKRSGVAVLTIKKGVNFGVNYKVRILLVVASTDKNEHFTVLKEAVKICTDENKVEKMLRCTKEEDLYRTIAEFSMES
jgi:Transcriptional antiterminator